MKKILTPGKWRGLKTTSDRGHTFSVLAFDQRGNYHRMLPEGTSYAEAAQIKREVAFALSPYVTAVLLDPNYGLPAALDLAGTSGLLMALEKTGYSGDPTARQVDFMDGWTVAKIKQMGASAVKLLVYYHPDTGAVAEHIETVIREVAEACTAHDMPLFVEPLAYNAMARPALLPYIGLIPHPPPNAEHRLCAEPTHPSPTAAFSGSPQPHHHQYRRGAALFQ